MSGKNSKSEPKLKKQNTALRARVDALERELEGSDQKTEMEARMINMEQRTRVAVAEMQRRAADFCSQGQALEDEVERLQAELDAERSGKRKDADPAAWGVDADCWTCETLQQQVDDQSKQLVAKDAELDGLRAELVFQREACAANNKGDTTEESVRTHEQTQGESEESARELQLERSVRPLRRKLEKNETEREQLMEKVNKLQEELQVHAMRKTIQQQVVGQLQQQVKSQSDQLEANDEEIDSLQQQVDSQSDQLEANDEAIESLQQQVDSQSNQLEVNDEEIESLQQQVESLLRVQLEVNEEEMTTLQQQVESQSKQLETLREEAESLTLMAAASDNDATQTSLKNNNLEQLVAELQAQLQGRVGGQLHGQGETGVTEQQLEKAVRPLRRKLEKNEMERQQLMEKVKQQQQENLEMSASSADVEERVQAMESSARAVLDSLVHKLELTMGEYKKLQKANSSLQAELDQERSFHKDRDGSSSKVESLSVLDKAESLIAMASAHESLISEFEDVFEDNLK